MKRMFYVLMVIAFVATTAITGCKSHVEDVDPYPPENKEQIRTQQEDDKDSIPPGHHPDNDDDDPYGGKYDPIWVH